MGTLFIAGVYGVGKSTLCEQLSNALNVPSFSAGDLISNINGEQYGVNKSVSDKHSNQEILVIEIQKQLEKHPKILLAGHFCIFNEDNDVDYLPDDVFNRLDITQILLLQADTNVLLSNLLLRDKREYTYEHICKLQQAEYITANRIAEQLDCNLIIHSMQFDGTDINKCLIAIENGDW